MNKNNKEVEFKYKVTNKRKLKSWLKRNAKKAYEFHQLDEYYTPAHKNYFDKEIPNEYLRIRQSGDKFSIAYKFWHEMKGTREHSHCDEYETDVENGNQMRKIFHALDLKLLIVVDKHRVAYNYKNFEIEVDDVNDIGLVCEIELKGGYKSIKEAHEMIRNLAEQIGFKEKDRGADLKLGYALMIAKKKGIV